MFFKREKPKMDDFERKKNLKEKFLTDTLAKSSQTNFAYYIVSEHSKHFFTCSFREDTHKLFF